MMMTKSCDIRSASDIFVYTFECETNDAAAGRIYLLRVNTTQILINNENNNDTNIIWIKRVLRLSRLLHSTMTISIYSTIYVLLCAFKNGCHYADDCKLKLHFM